MKIKIFGSDEAKPYIPQTYIWFSLGRPKIWRLKIMGPPRQDHIYFWPIYGFALADPKFLRLKNFKVYSKIQYNEHWMIT